LAHRRRGRLALIERIAKFLGFQSQALCWAATPVLLWVAADSLRNEQQRSQMTADVLLIKAFSHQVRVATQRFAHGRDVPCGPIIVRLETIREDVDVSHEPADYLVFVDDPRADRKRKGVSLLQLARRESLAIH
jgi:hypothetical protein